VAQEQTHQLNQSLAAHPDQDGYAARTRRALAAIPDAFLWIGGIALFAVAVGFRPLAMRLGTAGAVEFPLLLLVTLPLSWLPLALLHAVTGWPDGWIALVLWLAVVGLLLLCGPRFLPGRLREVWSSLFASPPLSTHGSAHFGRAKEAAAHLRPAAPDDAFTLGELRDVPRGADRRFRQDGHILTCAPTGAGKGIGAVIPNLLDYPGSAFVLDLKGENYAVTARARRAAGQDVFLIDPFGITGATGHAMSWLDALEPEDPEVVSLSGALADMLVVRAGTESDPHWNDSARELLRGLLVYVAGLPSERRNMAELRHILTAPEDDLAEILADMLADPSRGQRLVARTAAAHLNRPERERGSVLSTAVRHTTWLDDPRLCTALMRSDFTFRDLKRRPMTVYLAIPPDRLRACLGFVRGFIGLALNAISATPGQPAARVASSSTSSASSAVSTAWPTTSPCCVAMAPSSGFLSRTCRSSKPYTHDGRASWPTPASSISERAITTPPDTSATRSDSTRSASRPPADRSTADGAPSPAASPRRPASTSRGALPANPG
jgi:Type IV secretory system Conjugative DNA transfer